MLDSLHIKNFRCFEDLTIPSLGRVNLIVGKNNSGKSTLLEAVIAFAQHGREAALLDILNKRNESYSNQLKLESIYFNGSISPEGIFVGNKTQTLGFHFSEKRHHVFDDSLQLPDNFPQAFQNRINSHNYPFSSIDTCIKPDKDMAEIWDDIRIHKQDNLASEALQLVDSKVENVFYTTNRITMVSLAKERKARPIKSMGEGMSRLLQLFLHAFQARGGYLMIDEFENGLHYSIQEEVWEKLFKLAKELDIQIFATTHSRDTLEAFAKVAVANKEVEGKLITLGKNAGKTNRGRIISHVYNEEELEWIVNTRTEIR
ncbi:MAG TPA: AAA family ATPase [Candidatus Thiothrix moscowensis]|uniref:AAA family ATPase n=1 Tax=unclassified Thiothrix TaxID=2636184 RepID=UPI0025F132E4|nr:MULTISPECIES: ATP-binding protein [unclassified Thiothrix]HRJ52451.1 AAA family ATPase [Candidatus Thiothrix moscowensis]HRJ93363.1 AAA family ATPase [Candidatus Thiothrix moscowensis]